MDEDREWRDSDFKLKVGTPVTMTPSVCEMDGKEALVTILSGRTKISLSPPQARKLAAELLRWAEALETRRIGRVQWVTDTEWETP